MNPSSRIRKLYEQANLQIDPLVDQRILDTANDRLDQWTRSRPGTRRGCIWRFIMFNKYGRIAAIAVILLAVLLLAPHLVGVQTQTSPPDVKDIVTHSDTNHKNPLESPQKVKSLQEELLLADSLYAHHDQVGLLALLETGQEGTQIAVAGYLGEIGDEQVIPALQKLADTWQGDGENPYQQAIGRILFREQQSDSPNVEMPVSEDLSPSEEVRVESVERVICHGRVHDKMGLSIADVRVWAQAFNQKMEYNVLAEEAVTDKQGEFILKASALRNSNPQGLMVYFDHPDYGLWAYMIRHTPEESLSEAIEVTLYPSEQRGRPLKERWLRRLYRFFITSRMMLCSDGRVCQAWHMASRV